MLDFHAALEMPRADAQKSDTVAMRWVHVGLNLEYKSRKRRLIGLHRTYRRIPLARWLRPVEQRIQNLAHTKVIDCRAKEHRRLATVQKRRQIKRIRRTMD